MLVAGLSFLAVTGAPQFPVGTTAASVVVRPLAAAIPPASLGGPSLSWRREHDALGKCGDFGPAVVPQPAVRVADRATARVAVPCRARAGGASGQGGSGRPAKDVGLREGHEPRH